VRILLAALLGYLRSNSRGAVNLALKYIIPLILGLVIIVIYLIFFGAPRIIDMINQSFPTL
jgi:hypothetical protein